MQEKKISSLNLFIIFFLSYSFYVTQVLTQQLFSFYGKQSVIIMCISQLLFPVMVYITCKMLNKNMLNNTKNNFIFSILSSLYLIITSIISITIATNIIVIYYYQNTSFMLLLLFLSLPIIYNLIKGEHHFFSLGAILLIVYSIFKYSYLANSSSIDLYVFSNIFKINSSNIFPLIIYSLPILLEPLLLLNNQNIIYNKINTKLIVSFSIVIAIIGIVTILRQTWEFGTLLDKIKFPYLESIKNITAGKFFENIDFYYLLSIAVSIYTRTTYSIITIKKSFNLKNSISIAILLSILILVYILQKSMNLYIFSVEKILIITSTCLIICLILFPFLTKRRKNNYA